MVEVIVNKKMLWGYFDGAYQSLNSTNNIRGILYFTKNNYIPFKKNLKGTNNYRMFMFMAIKQKKKLATPTSV